MNNLPNSPMDLCSYIDKIKELIEQDKFQELLDLVIHSNVHEESKSFYHDSYFNRSYLIFHYPGRDEKEMITNFNLAEFMMSLDIKEFIDKNGHEFIALPNQGFRTGLIEIIRSNKPELLKRFVKESKILFTDYNLNFWEQQEANIIHYCIHMNYHEMIKAIIELGGFDLVRNKYVVHAVFFSLESLKAIRDSNPARFDTIFHPKKKIKNGIIDYNFQESLVARQLYELDKLESYLWLRKHGLYYSYRHPLYTALELFAPNIMETIIHEYQPNVICNVIERIPKNLKIPEEDLYKSSKVTKCINILLFQVYRKRLYGIEFLNPDDDIVAMRRILIHNPPSADSMKVMNFIEHLYDKLVAKVNILLVYFYFHNLLYHTLFLVQKNAMYIFFIT